MSAGTGISVTTIESLIRIIAIGRNVLGTYLVAVFVSNVSQVSMAILIVGAIAMSLRSTMAFDSGMAYGFAVAAFLSAVVFSRTMDVLPVSIT